MGRRGDKPERHSIYEFEDTALDLAQVYRFSIEFPVALRSEDYKQYIERQKADRQHLENLADRWLEAEEKVETGSNS